MTGGCLALTAGERAGRIEGGCHTHVDSKVGEWSEQLT